MPANTVTKCGFLYNWFTATNGTGTSAVINPQRNICHIVVEMI
jgi:hypothetical protein